jgi:glycogen operon protein
MAILDSIKVQKGNAYPLGVSIQASGGIQIAFWHPGGEKCRLCLYDGGKSRKIKMYPMTDVGLPDIFSVILSGDGIEENLKKAEYDFAVDGVHYTDPFAREVSGRSVFGKGKGKIRSRFVLDSFDWTGENWHKLPNDEMILYQCHVRGFTKHSSSGVEAPGTFLGLQEKIPYLKKLGVNTLLLLPVYDFDECMRDNEGSPTGKINYWGYTGDAFYLAPKAGYCSGKTSPSVEFQQMVKALHKNGMNVILDMYFSGKSPQFIINCLCYYALHFHVDGFRINQDCIDMAWLVDEPVLSHVKMFGNNWPSRPEDVGKEMFFEMNDGFMVDARRYLKSDEGQAGTFYQRFKEQGNGIGQIHYITQNNGFTLRDLISYDVKHNEANGERNMDGTQYNYSWNCGVEGMTRRKPILRIRKKQEKNALVMLFLGMAVPMLLAGDEFGNSQKGNNNAYCQDNLTTWLDWRLLEKNQDTFDFARQLISFRKKHPLYHGKKQLNGMDFSGKGAPDVSCHGREPWVADFSYYSREVAILYYGSYFGGRSLYFAFNFYWDKKEFFLPDVEKGSQWKVILDTADSKVEEITDGRYVMAPRSITVFESVCTGGSK